MKDRITVCICTFGRNQMLERLLRSLKLQETTGLFDFSVVVVDNDASGPARDTVMRLKAELGLEIDYGVEPEQIIPAARNHALRLARGNYIGIIDDDEFPSQTWNQTRTGNVLLKREVFDKRRLRFDLKWKTSGSDRAFFKQAIQLGCRFIAVEEAPVYENGPPERWKGNQILAKCLGRGGHQLSRLCAIFGIEPVKKRDF
jgi:glycosyltransferase involved in cell wall biosynthesis